MVDARKKRMYMPSLGVVQEEKIGHSTPLPEKMTQGATERFSSTQFFAPTVMVMTNLPVDPPAPTVAMSIDLRNMN